MVDSESLDYGARQTKQRLRSPPNQQRRNQSINLKLNDYEERRMEDPTAGHCKHYHSHHHHAGHHQLHGLLTVRVRNLDRGCGFSLFPAHRYSATSPHCHFATLSICRYARTKQKRATHADCSLRRERDSRSARRDACYRFLCFIQTYLVNIL